MTDDILGKRDPHLATGTVLHDSPAPREITTDEPAPVRVARPIRHVKFIPTKALVFHSKAGPIEFSYANKIQLPINKNRLVVEVHYVGLNPVDLKIKNGYSSAIYGEVGLGREYSGVISQVGENLQGNWRVGDEVFGIYFHPRLAKGTLQTSILIDPSVDPVVLRPRNISPREAGCSLFCLGAAYNILDRLSSSKVLTTESNILINGGTSSVGMFTIQLLKYYYNVQKKLVIVTTGSSAEKLRDLFPDIADDMIFIDYLACRGKSRKPLEQMIESESYTTFVGGQSIEVPYYQGKFDIVLDFIGGYDIVKHSKTLIQPKGTYLTTVGDYVGDYKNDVYNQTENPSASARRLFGSMLWSYDYIHFNFNPSAKTASSNDWINKCGDLLADGTVRCIIDKTYDWKKVKEAVAYMATQRAQGKIVLEVEQF